MTGKAISAEDTRTETKVRVEGTGYSHNLLRQMSKATYRGVKYDTNTHAQKETKQVTARETYRGIKHTETVEVRK